jgi:hypothetical protein
MPGDRLASLVSRWAGYRTHSVREAGAVAGPARKQARAHHRKEYRDMTEPTKFLSSRFLSASTLLGASVRNLQDESLSFGGLLGMGDKLFAIPWENFRVDAETERLVLDISKDRLKGAPEFDADHWPDFAERQPGP